MLTEKDYCDYETCVALKELGYEGTAGECSNFGAFFMNGKEIFYDRLYNSELEEDECLRVPLYLAQKWLREEKKIEVNATYDNVVELHWHWYMKSLTNCNQDISIINCDSYEQALLTGIKEAVKILTNNKNE
jgi:hypothetical protein